VLLGQGLAKGHVLNRKAGKGITRMASVTLLAWCVFFRGRQGERFSLAVFWVPIGEASEGFNLLLGRLYKA
jgi:hypothetical protein